MQCMALRSQYKQGTVKTHTKENKKPTKSQTYNTIRKI